MHLSLDVHKVYLPIGAKVSYMDALFGSLQVARYGDLVTVAMPTEPFPDASYR